MRPGPFGPKSVGGDDHQFQRDLYTLQCAGFCILPDFKAPAEIDRLAARAFEWQAEVNQFLERGGDLPYRAGWPLQNARALFAVDEIFQDLVQDPRILAYADGYLGDAELRDCHLLTNMPDPRNATRGRDAGVNYHRDKKWPDDEPVQPSYLHCFVLLTDMTRDNGGTLIVPGTHREREADYYFLETDPGRKVEGNWYKVYDRRYFPGAIQVEAKRGSLVLFDPTCIHAQGINVTEERRSVINATFHRRGLPGILNCRAIAEKSNRIPLKRELLLRLCDTPEASDTYGPFA